MSNNTEEEYSFRLFDFVISDPEYEVENSESDDSSDVEYDSDGRRQNVSSKKKKTDQRMFTIQMFGIDEKGDTYSIMVNDVKPFFYVMVDDDWGKREKTRFLAHLREKAGEFYADSILSCDIEKHKKLYGFDQGKEYNFIKITFANTIVMSRVKKFWYIEKTKAEREESKDDRFFSTLKMSKVGYVFANTATKLYEAKIPPLLRYFHIRNLSPSGWVRIKDSDTIKSASKSTTCKYEFEVSEADIISDNDKETAVPYKICSFDIEASSSHGDFPIPVKSYKKLATNILDYYLNNPEFKDETVEEQIEMLKRIVFTAFRYDTVEDVDFVYPKKKYKPKSKEIVLKYFDKWVKTPIVGQKNDTSNALTIGKMFENAEHGDGEETNDANDVSQKKRRETVVKKNDKIMDILNNPKFKRDELVNHVDATLTATFPPLEGDKVTLIGSTFIRQGIDDDPYLNHAVVLNTCDPVDSLENTEVKSCDTEKDLLLEWTKVIQREDPDIIIGYNIFGFDYEFMFQRARENGISRKFLQLSRNKGEVCGKKDRNDELQIEESTLIIASGQHDLKFIKMAGRLQVDLYNYFRREQNLTSYKLDSVAGEFIGDKVKSCEWDESKQQSLVKSGNLTGLKNKTYICFEEIGHSTEKVQDGHKFIVDNVDEKAGTFTIEEDVKFTPGKPIRWCMAKDDVTPQDLFRLANGTSADRAIIAKYCYQDCNLVHHLMKKMDIITGFVEMAKICSVPMSFIVMRGQGIKLLSFVAKKCRAKNTLMPDIEKNDNDGGYEGAIVLPPKCDLYLDEPVACVDYSSLYPSSMISEGLSHDSKVWTKEYDLEGNLRHITGEKDDEGNFIYDNLPRYKYVDVTYDTYNYRRKPGTSTVVKELCGKKTCRFAQFPDGKKPIMPSILEELLAARKATRKKIKTTDDEFMKNVLDKRQLSYKITANSLYGQCGAKTSSFYEKDVAASTTATGRKLLIYAKHIIEEVYGDRIVETSLGKVHSHAEYIYGDTDSVFMSFKLTELDGTPITGRKALIMTIELAKEAGELATKFLKKPHDLEYEKTFMPFALLSKKRYVGMLYEEDPDKCKCKSMGIVLKRRDNAPIVKDVYGGVIDILMKDKNIQKAIDFTKQCLQNIVDEKYPIEKLIISKSLRGYYKNPKQIAHKVLADRMGKRDAGNKPAIGDRVPFVYISAKNKKTLQGDRIETPEFIKENNIRPDYSFYITNQIMKPLQQVFALVLEKIPAFKKKVKMFHHKVKAQERMLKDDVEKFARKEADMRNKEVKGLIFDEYLRQSENLKKGNVEITKIFKAVS